MAPYILEIEGGSVTETRIRSWDAKSFSRTSVAPKRASENG